MRSRLGSGVLGRRIPGLLIRILLRDRLGGEQLLPTHIGGAGQGEIGQGGIVIGFRLVQLSVHFRRIDFRE